MEDIGGTLGTKRLDELKKRLVTVAEHHFSRTKRCVEMCQRQFEIVVDGLIREDQSETENDYVSPLGMLGGMRNANIPFPRTCGARFDGADKLVVFGVRKVPVLVKVRNRRIFTCSASAGHEEIEKNVGFWGPWVHQVPVQIWGTWVHQVPEQIWGTWFRKSLEMKK